MVTVSPSRDLTVRVWPSSFSTVPRMRVGVPCGACWATAGKANIAISAPANSDLVVIAVLPWFGRDRAVAVFSTNHPAREFRSVSHFGDRPSPVWVTDHRVGG